MSALLAARGVDLAHPRAPGLAVRGLELEIRRGELVALVGANASGKSTTLAAFARALRPRAGRIELDGRDVHALGRREYARRVAFLPQEPSCAPGLTVEALAACGRFAHGSPLREPDAAERERIAAALRAADVAELAERRVESLSGGERRRAFVAMVLAQDADVLLLDEPTSGLDLRHRLALLELVAQLVRTRGKTVLCALHELDLAARVADRVAVLQSGRLEALGPPREVLDPALLRRAFGVDAELSWRDGRPLLHVHGAAS